MHLAVLFAGLCLAAGPDAELSISHEKYILPDNGLTVILSHDETLPVVAVNVWYHAGPVNEKQGRTGFAHLFEHLMFQGSGHVGDDAHFKMLEAAGATGINGTTDYDRTNYFETVPSNQLALALWLESDRMGFLRETLTQKKLDNQRSVVMNERRQRIDNVPYGPSGEALVQQLFPKEHPYYGYVIGSMGDLAAASLDDAKAFYHQYYAPSNATLSIVGNFDDAEAKALVQRYFGTLPRREKPKAVKIARATMNAERRVVLEAPVPTVQVQMAWLSPPLYAPGDADCDVLAFALGQGKSSRMYRHLVYDKRVAQNVHVMQRSAELSSMFQIIVRGHPGISAAVLEKEIQSVLDELALRPITDIEMTRARNTLKTQTVAHLQSVSARANMLNRYQRYLGRTDALAWDLGRYEKVSAVSLQKLASNLLVPHQRAVVVTVPEAKR